MPPAGELTAEPPADVLAFNDRSALAVVDQLRRSGHLVPDELSGVGYDDSPVAWLATVDLTSVSQAPQALGDSPIGVLIKRLESGRTAATEVLIDPYLVVRGSTRPARRRDLP